MERHRGRCGKGPGPPPGVPEYVLLCSRYKAAARHVWGTGQVAQVGGAPGRGLGKLLRSCMCAAGGGDA